eukprot:scaffold96840_cov32-Attheya_sp.AAC.1
MNHRSCRLFGSHGPGRPCATVNTAGVHHYGRRRRAPTGHSHHPLPSILIDHPPSTVHSSCRSVPGALTQYGYYPNMGGPVDRAGPASIIKRGSGASSSLRPALHIPC